MSKKIISAILMGVSLYYSVAAHASDEKGRYWIYGVGRQTCETYLEARKTGGFSEISYKNWVSGYLTSSNRATDDTYNLLGNTDFHGAMVWLDRYCKKNGKNTVYMAMANLTAVVYKNRRTSK
jgi:hypothetical protein